MIQPAPKPQGCGCAAVPPEIVSTRAAMCATCPKAVRKEGVAVGCSVNGRLLNPADLGRASRLGLNLSTPRAALTDPAATCPLSRWPDEQGIVTWRKVRWFGVPDPLRWVFFWRAKRETKAGGCGCSVRLKTGRLGRFVGPIMELSPKLRRWMARTPAIREALADLKERW
jgi:hypothetical protein